MPLPRLLVRLGLLLAWALTTGIAAAAPERPNILWLTSEDHGPHLGCYGDTYATTPHVDALAAQGLRYDHAWSNAPVCAPARTTLISGLYPPSTGTQHMRSFAPAPTDKPPYPVFLRQAGYYCTNNAKTDYNLTVPADLWDESSEQAHWRNRSAGQPFFAIFNAFASHESQLRKRPHQAVHDPDAFVVPPYHPDDPIVRQDWAQYYDTVTAADAAAGRRLAELAADGLTDDTIVFYFSDHGAGMPGHKRTPNNRGLQVALIVYIPEKFADLRPADYAPGGASDRLVSFIDFAPTLLSLVDIAPPDWMQGHAFLGHHIAPAPRFMFGFRGRMDERTDFVRTITDGRYVYLRNYRPDLPAGQHVDYQFETPSTRRWVELYRDGQLNDAQAAYWEPTPHEELYDLQTDPHEIHNLATDPNAAAIKTQLATALTAHLINTRDLGFLPEGELKLRTAGAPPYDWARRDNHYPIQRLAAIADRATQPAPLPPEIIRDQLADPAPGVRYWTLRHLALQPPSLVAPFVPRLRELMDDASPDVAITAADLLGHFGNRNDLARALDRLVTWADPAGDHFVARAALETIDNFGPLAAPLRAQIATFPRESTHLPHERYRFDIDKLIAHILGTPSNDPRTK